MLKRMGRKVYLALENIFFAIEVFRTPLRKFNPQKTIVIVTHDVSQTGAPILASKLSQVLRTSGYSTIVIPMKRTSDCHFMSESTDLLFGRNITVENSVFLIKKLYRKGICRVICNTLVSGELTQVFKKYGFTTISLVHEMIGSTKILKAEKMIRVISENADYIVFPGKIVRENFESWGYEIKGKTIILPPGNYKENNGIYASDDYRKKLIDLLKCDNNSVFFGGSGSINFGKGVDLLPLIAELMIKREKDLGISFHYIWLGSSHFHSDYEIWLKNQIALMGLESRIHFMGNIEDEKQYLEKLAGCSAFMLLSREDSMPAVLFEAMSIGLPVVTFKKNGGADELLSENRGYLVDYMNINMYSETLLGVIQNEEMRNITTKKAEYDVKLNYSFLKYVKVILETLNS